MSNAQARTQRVVRRLGVRETHSSRAALSIVCATVLLAVVLWLLVELVLSVTGNPVLLMAPADLAQRAGSLATATLPEALIAAGVVLALLGATLVAAAVLPGAKARHVMGNPTAAGTPRSAVVVDSDVLAGVVSRIARTVAKIAPDQVTSSVGRKRLDVVLRPSSGRDVDVESVKDAVAREMTGYGLRRPLAVTVSTSMHKAVGA